MKLLKQNARKPLIEGGSSIGSASWDDKAVVYELDLYPSDNRAHHYRVLLTRPEMLQAVSSWMEKEARDANDAARKEKALSSC